MIGIIYKLGDYGQKSNEEVFAYSASICGG